MKINVLKFGGSSVANNINLNIVAERIIDFKKSKKDVVVIVSAQGKTTDNLIKEAKELSALPNDRELDALMSVGEQISACKLSILLNRLGYSSISLNGWQAGIRTSNDFENAKIRSINTSRIIKELADDKIVIITGFQGIDDNNNITTLGRGGSDTSAVAIASVLNAEHCYIFSDVDGVYTTDPNKVNKAIKLKNISYKEMELASNEGAKVLHDRCVELAEKNDLEIIAASTFNKEKGTVINDLNKNIEESQIKSIVKNDNISLIIIQTKNKKDAFTILKLLVEEKIKIGYYKISDNSIEFSIMNKDRDHLIKLTDENNYRIKIKNTSKLSLIGIGVSNNFKLIKYLIESIQKEEKNILFFDISAYKISIQFDKVINDELLLKLHEKLF